MKKILTVVLTVILTFSTLLMSTMTKAVATTAMATNTHTILLGDADSDGNLNSTDVWYIMYYIALVGVGYSKEEAHTRLGIEFDEKIFDVDRNEKVDSTDVFYLMVYIAKSGAGQDATWPPAPEKIYTDDILVFNPVKGVETWNLRSAPSLEANVVTKMTAGETCKVIKIMPENWYEVEYFGYDLYLQITPDSKNLFYVNPISQTSTITETTTTNTEETTTTGKTTKLTTESTITMTKSETTTFVTTKTKTTTATTTTETTAESTTTVKTTDNSTTTSTEFTTTSVTTTEKLQLGDIVTPTETVKLTNSNGEIIVEAGEHITIVAVNESNKYIVIYQKRLYELDEIAHLNKVEHKYQEKQLSNVEEIEEGDILKFTGNTWYIRDKSQSAVGTLKKNELFVVMEKNENILTIITSEGTVGNIFCIADKYCVME